MSLCFLVADDESTNRNMFGRFIKLARHDVIMVENGLEAWRILESGRKIDHIISDNDMPEMTGVELLRRVRADGRFSHIPFALMSGGLTVSEEDSTLLQDIASERTMDSFWSKPVSIPDMLTQLELEIKKRG